MRRWMKKWQGLIIWVVAGFFIAGIAWWSIAAYMRSSAPKVQHSLEDAVAYLTKDGTPMNDPTYWVMGWELETKYSDLLRNLPTYSLDPVFEDPKLKALVLEKILENKVMMYYANEENLLPNKKEIDREVNNILEGIKRDKAKQSLIIRRYGTLTNYINNYLKPSVKEELTLKKVREKVMNVTDDEVKRYYEEHKKDIMLKYDKADLVSVSFDKEEDARAFVNKAAEIGFEKAATSMGLEAEELNSFSRGILGDEVDNIVFSASPNSIVGPFNVFDKWYVFKVKDVKKVDTYENFVISDAFQDVKSQISNEKYNKWIENYKKEKHISYVIKDEVYGYWLEVMKRERDEEDIWKELKNYIFEEGNIREDAKDELKAIFVVVSEDLKFQKENELRDLKSYKKDLEEGKEISENLKKKYGELSKDELEQEISKVQAQLDEIEDLYRRTVEDLYEGFPTSMEVLRRMVQIKPEDRYVRFEYYSQLYSRLKPFIQYGQVSSILNDILQTQIGLLTVAMATDVSTDVRAEAYYDLYDMSISMGDATSAKYYLDSLKEIAPDYMDFEGAYEQIEAILSSTPSENLPSTPTENTTSQGE